jgi:hypothetical protein
LGIKAPDYA